MQKQASILITVFLIVCNSNNLFACMCLGLKSFERQISESAFIAHVKITNEVIENDTIISKGKITVRFAHESKLRFEIIELFKGSVINDIQEYDVNTSCEVGVDAGEEWLLYASYDSVAGHYWVGGCSPSTIYRNKNGERNWHFWRNGNYILGELKKYFNHPEDPQKNGSYTGYYKNGCLEYTVGYLNGELHGKRNVYFSNGQIHIDENYSNGSLHGIGRVFSRRGQLLEEYGYEQGKKLWAKEWADTSKRYLFRSSLTQEYKNIKVSIRLISESKYYDSTYGIEKRYKVNGQLESETITNEADSMYSVTDYYRSGRIHNQYTWYRKENKKVSKVWNEKGQLVEDKIMIDGKVVEDNLDKRREGN